MWWLCCNTDNSAISHYNSYREYYAAGIHFTDFYTILAGAQPVKNIPCISGFGGRKIGADKSSMHTAFRETIEELYGFTVKQDFIDSLVSDCELIPHDQEDNDGYIFYVLDYEQLLRMTKYVWKKYGIMPHYKEYPETIDELINKRTQVEENEVSSLYKIDIKTNTIAEIDGLPLDRLFLEDIQVLHLILYSKKLKKCLRIV